ncbi:DUF7342 family protein [Halomicrobium salinisoli]|uniref:DUF7342 family protein n=1 Tax=Halomicrobium salinisoli TaxID=2878391 RepID=UPI001CEFC45F|nr:sugar-specific transcriptional regulator TrmB [Halomicrobium salinisoli]
MSDPEPRDGPPPFDDAFGDDVEQRVYGTILQTREPSTANTIANRADCDPKSARKYLEWFAELGVVTRHDGGTTTYERNDAYFEWRRVEEIAADNSLDEIRDRVRDLTDRIGDYERTYDAAAPSEVDAVAAAEERNDRSIDEVYADLADWTTASHERRRYERARQRRAGADGEQVSG